MRDEETSRRADEETRRRADGETWGWEVGELDAAPLEEEREQYRGRDEQDAVLPTRFGYRRSPAWRKAMDLVGAVYAATSDWPTEERFGLTNQARRSVVSIPANIAEGQGRIGSRELKHRVSIAHGSLCELETLLLVGQRLGFSDRATTDRMLDLADEVGRMLRAMLRTLG